MSRLVRDEEIDATIEALRKAREARGQTPDRPPTEEERWEEFKKEPPAYLRGLSREQLKELNELAGTAVGAAEGFTPESAAEMIPFVAGGKDFADTVAAEQLALKVQSGQATPEENFEFAKSQVEARRERTFMGGVGEMARSTVPIMGELGIAAATGAGATGLAGRIALNEAKRQSKREIAKAMLKVGLKEMGTGTGQVLSTVAAREAIPRLLGHGGGTWSGNALKRALPDLEFTPEELEELAVLADRDFADRLMGKMREESSVWAGALEDFVSVGVERGAGAMIGRLPGIAKAKAIQARVWQKLAGSGSKAQFMAGLADDVAYAGALEETLEELFQGAVTEELFGDGVLEGLPSTFQELGQIAMVGALPAGIAAPFARAAEISSQRQREEAFKRANPEQAEGSPTGTPASGGDSVSSGEATAATAGVEPDVIQGEAAASPQPQGADLSPEALLAPQDVFAGPQGQGTQAEIGRSMHGSLTEIPDVTEGQSVSAPDVMTALGGIVESAGIDPTIRQGLAANVPQGASGAYWLRTRVMDVRKANDIVTGTHEVAHALERAVYGQFDPWQEGGAANLNAAQRDELYRLGKALYGDREPNGGYLREGWAEFMTYVVTQEGTREAPQMTRWLNEEFLPAHPEVAEAVAKAQGYARVWRHQGSVKRAQRSIAQTPGRVGRVAQGARELATRSGLSRVANYLEDKLFEELGPLRRAVQAAQKVTGKALAPAQDAYRIANALRGTAGSRIRAMIEHGMIDLFGNRTGVPPLKDIESMLKGREEDFLIYLWARRGKALWEQPVADGLQEGQTLPGAIAELRRRFRDPQTGQEPTTERVLLAAGARDPGLSYVDTLQILEEYDDAGFERPAELVYQWYDGVMDYVAQASPTLAEAVKKIREVDPGAYIPLQREFERLEGMAGRSVGRAASGSITKRLKGSGRRIKNPLEQLLSRATELVQMSHERRALDAFIEMGEAHDGLGALVREVPVSQVPGGSLTVDDALREAAKRIGREDADAAEIVTGVREMLGESSDAVITLFSRSYSPKQDGSAPILPVARNGSIKWFQMDPEVYEVFRNINPPRIKGVADLILGAPKRWFTMGTTGLNPAFAFITNPTRDPQTLAANTSAGNPFRALWLALGSVKDSFEASLAKPGEADSYAQVLVRTGVPIRAMLAHDTVGTKVQAEVLAGGGNKVARKLNDTWDVFTHALGAPEFISRIAEMKVVGKRLGWEPGQYIDENTAIQLLEAAKGVTVDFSAAGEFTRTVNRYVPFFNVAFQSTRAFAKAVARDPKTAIPRGLAAFTIPTIAYWLAFHDDEWYEEMADEQRYRYWYLPTANGELIRVPRAFEPAYVYSTTFEAMLNSMAGVNPESANGFAERFLEGVESVATEGGRTFMPNMLPGPVEAFYEHQTNEDTFFGTPIIPRNLENTSPQYQSTEWTSNAAKSIGRTLGLSPILIEHYMESVFGTVAREGFRLTGRDLDLVEGESQLADTIFIGRVFQRGGQEGVRSRSVNEVYETYRELDRRRNDLRAQRKTETPEQRQERLWFSDAIAALSAFSDIKRYVQTKDERRALLRERRRFAQMILDDYKSGRMNRGATKAEKNRLQAQADQEQREFERKLDEQTSDAVTAGQ